MSEFSVYSIGIYLTRYHKDNLFVRFMDEVLEGTGVEVIRLPLQDLKKVVDNRLHFKLDFDDAYQYTVAEKHDLTLVSFDKDFDRTERGRKTPAEILNQKT